MSQANTLTLRVAAIPRMPAEDLHPADGAIPGVYEVEISNECPPGLRRTAALNGFRDSIAVAAIDAFDLVAFDPMTGIVIGEEDSSETGRHPRYTGRASKVDSDVPARFTVSAGRVGGTHQEWSPTGMVEVVAKDAEQAQNMGRDVLWDARLDPADGRAQISAWEIGRTHTLNIAAINQVPRQDLDPETDDGIPGVYEVEISNDCPRRLRASAALDGFHDRIGVDDLDAFAFVVFDPATGAVLHEAEDAEGYQNKAYAVSAGKIDDSVPAVFAVDVTCVGDPGEAPCSLGVVEVVADSAEQAATLGRDLLWDDRLDITGGRARIETTLVQGAPGDDDNSDGGED